MNAKSYRNLLILTTLLAFATAAFAQGTNPYLPNPPVKRKATDSASKLNPIAVVKTGKPAMTANAGMPNARQSKPDSGWEFTVTPYFFMSGIEGTLGARGRTINVNADFGSIWDRLDFGFMGMFQARKGRFLFTNDFQWIKMSNERTAVGIANYRYSKATAKMLIWDPEVGVRLAQGKAGTLDLTGGVRVWSVENSLETTSGLSTGFTASQRKTWAAPVVGVNGTLNLSKAFYLATRMDVGGGIGADTTSQFYGGAGLRFSPNFALTGGWRYQQVKYDDDSGFVFDTSMQGPVIGARFIFK